MNHVTQKNICTACSLGALALGAALVLSLSSGPVIAADKYSSAAELGLMEGFPPPADKQINRSNALFAAPYNRWSYLHMREFYPSVGIPAADKVSKLKFSIDKGIDGVKFNAPDIAGEETGAYVPGDKMVDMPTWFRETYKDAVVVIKGDEIVYEKYLNGMDGNTVHQMMSVTKSFAGLFGLMAVEAGEASENDPVTRYIPELKSSGAFNGATFGQVLDMSNSMDFSEDYADPDSEIVQYTVVLGLTEPAAGQTYADNIYDYLVTLKKDPKHSHGDVFHYQTPKTDVVNWTTNRATNMSFMDNFYEKLWSKIGAEGETYVLLDKNATLFAGGGLNATPYDLARFATMMLNDGKHDGKQVVSPAIIKKLSDGGSKQAFKDGYAFSGIMNDGHWSYRAQWWVTRTPGREAFMALGIHGQIIYVDVDRDVAVIIQSSEPVSADDYYTAYNLLGIQAIVDRLSK